MLIEMAIRMGATKLRSRPPIPGDLVGHLVTHQANSFRHVPTLLLFSDSQHSPIVAAVVG
jgi:hypothetical protein